jgi:hypothetical protein
MRSLLTLCCCVVLSGCAIIVAPNDGDIQVRSAFGSDAVVGDGRLIQERRAIGSLPGLDVSGPLQVEVRVGAAPSLQIEADGNLLPLIRSEATGGTLRIWTERALRSNNNMRVIYTVPQLTQVQSSGSGRLTISDLNGAPLILRKSGSGAAHLSGRVSSLDVQMSGSGQLDASALESGNANLSVSGSARLMLGQLRADAVTVRVRGSGGLQASGAVQSLNAHVHGSGDANLAGLSSQQADLSTSGSGDISAMVKQSLIAQTTGSGHIKVFGNPAQRSVSGKHVLVLN